MQGLFYGAKELNIKIDDMEMDYITFGSGQKTMIMIQGLNTKGIRGASKMLAFMYRMFAKTYTVYLFDRPKKIKEDVTVRELARAVAMAMDALHLSDADILGVSQGGMIAQNLALDRPDLVHKLVLAVTLSKNNETVCNVLNQWIRWTEQGENRLLIKDMTYKMYSDAYIKRYQLLLPLLNILQKPEDPVRFMTLAKACLTCDTYERLPQINCPVLVIGGGKDQIVTGAASREIADKMHCSLYIYETLGHAAYEEANDFNKKVYEFFVNN